MNENTVSLHLSETNVLAIYALLGQCMSGGLISDLGLEPLYNELEANFQDQETVNVAGFLTRASSDIPSAVIPRHTSRHTIIELV